MTKYFFEVFETVTINGKQVERLKSQEETISLNAARDLKLTTTLLSNESARIHICKHGDEGNENNLPCEVI